MASHNPNRIWEACLKKATSRKTRDKLRTKIKEISKNKQGLSSSFLTEILFELPNFIGVFPQDFLCSLDIITIPVSFIINLDLSSEPGSHWLALIISEKSIEIYDSFGLDPKSWQRKPSLLFRFLKKFETTHKIFILPKFQPLDSNLCGVYCIFFLIIRLSLSFTEIKKLFTSDTDLNSSILLSFFE